MRRSCVFRNLFLILGWVFLFAIRLTASQITEIQREVHWPHELSDLPPDPKAVWGHLENGFRYVILPNDEPPDEVVMRLFVGAGSLMEEENEQGIAHFIEHMAFRGTKHYPRDSLIRYFQKTGMEFGPHINAHTGLDQTVYDLQIPATSKETLADSLQVLRDYAVHYLNAKEQASLSLHIESKLIVVSTVVYEVANA